MSAKSYVLAVIATLMEVMLLGGCAFLNQQSIDNHFDGITAAMSAKPITCVLFVHGMGGYSNDDPHSIMQGLLNIPTIRQTAAEHPVDLDDGAATLTRQDFLDTKTNHQLRAYTLYWEAITQPLKAQYLAYDQDADLTSKRLDLIGAGLRKGILDGAVPDVVLYVGHYKPVIQNAVRQALKRMHEDVEARDNKQDDYEYIFVTWSLGSKIVFDCLADPKITASQSTGPTTQAVADDYTFNKIANKTRAVYMLANQLPLLTLGDVEAENKSAPKPYQALLSVANRRKQISKIQIVAFSDPNDLLSYSLPHSLIPPDDADVSNVSISIAKTAVYIPFVGWAYNPETAHTGYALNPQVVDLILNGDK